MERRDPDLPGPLAAAAFWGALAATAALALLPAPPELLAGQSDRVRHALAFFGLAALHRAAFPEFGPWRRLLLMAAIGAAIEVAQALPALERDPEWLDLAADVAGAGVAIALGWILPPRRAHASAD